MISTFLGAKQCSDSGFGIWTLVAAIQLGCFYYGVLAATSILNMEASTVPLWPEFSNFVQL